MAVQATSLQPPPTRFIPDETSHFIVLYYALLCFLVHIGSERVSTRSKPISPKISRIIRLRTILGTYTNSARFTRARVALRNIALHIGAAN